MAEPQTNASTTENPTLKNATDDNPPASNTHVTDLANHPSDTTCDDGACVEVCFGFFEFHMSNFRSVSAVGTHGKTIHADWSRAQSTFEQCLGQIHVDVSGVGPVSLNWLGDNLGSSDHHSRDNRPIR